MPLLELDDSLEGLRMHTSSRGHRIIRLHYSADPDKRRPEFAIAARQRAGSDKEYRREYELDWSSAEGDEFYPEFSELGRDHYVRPCPELIYGPVYRGWDFGFRHPACIWFQYSAKSDRLWVLREFAPENLATHFFRDGVLYFSGQLPYGYLHENTRAWVDAYEGRVIEHKYADGRVEQRVMKGPWFSRGVRFEDYAGPEANHIEAIAARDPQEAMAAQVLASSGIILNIHAGRVKARCDVMRRFLPMRADGYPGVLVDPVCGDVLKMYGGGLAYPKPTKLVPVPLVPKKDGFFDDIHDALTYGVVGVVPAVEPKKSELRSAADSAPAMSEIGWYETRVRRPQVSPVG